MFCKECGTQLPASANVCSNCGRTVNDGYGGRMNPADNGGFLWGMLGFCIPIAGLILFLVWKTDRPKTAKSAGIGALISVLGIVGFYFILIVLAVAFA